MKLAEKIARRYSMASGLDPTEDPSYYQPPTRYGV